MRADSDEDESEDEAVWHEVLGGDADAFGLIWDRHRDRIFRHLRKLGSSSDEVEDLTATVFLELWRKRRSVRFVDGSLVPWLLVTALYISRNSDRAKRRYRAFLAKLPPPENVKDPSDQFGHDAGISAEVTQVLAASNPADRNLLALTALEDLTVREAAIAVGISEAAAKMRLSRLRSRLRTAMVHQQSTMEGSACHSHQRDRTQSVPNSSQKFAGVVAYVGGGQLVSR